MSGRERERKDGERVSDEKFPAYFQKRVEEKFILPCHDKWWITSIFLHLVVVILWKLYSRVIIIDVT